jgi:hypothetical protein
MVSQLDTEKKYKFQTCISFILLAFISRKVLEIMFTWLFDYLVSLCCRHEKGQKGCNTWLQWLHAARNFKTRNLHVFGKKKSNLVKFQSGHTEREKTCLREIYLFATT